MSNKALQRMGNSSALAKEERIFKIFAYLNTKNEFNPMNLGEKVLTTPTTLLSYLKAIQKAQFFSNEYIDWVERPFEEQVYGNSKGEQKELALKSHGEWKKRVGKIDQTWKEKNQELLQFQYTQNPHVSRELFYSRLEYSLLVYSVLSKNKKKS